MKKIKKELVEEGINIFEEELRERRFINALQETGGELIPATKMVFPKECGSLTEEGIKCKGMEMLRRPRVQKEMRKVLDSLSVTPRRIVGDIEKISREAKRDSDKLKALELLGKFLKLFEEQPKNVTLNTYNISEDAAIRMLERRAKFQIEAGGKFAGIRQQGDIRDDEHGEEESDRLLLTDAEELSSELAS